ncbi:MAG: cupin domain-containing protein [Actinobacteria bacterium]|nr:cupin domain-containing protein [Actinomycetota bacterium]
MPASAVKHRDEFERMAGSGGCTWMLARKALGTEAFGYNMVEIEPGGAMPAHDESGSRQVEIYVILEGEAVVVVDGEEHAAPAGTFASLEPDSERTVLNRSSSPLTLLVFGSVPGPGYHPPSWA